MRTYSRQLWGKRLLPLLAVLPLCVLTACSTNPSSFPLATPSASPPPLTPLSSLPEPPETWTLTGSSSLYLTLFHSTSTIAPLGEFPSKPLDELVAVDIDGNGEITEEEALKSQRIDDRIVTAVAADLVVQFFDEGTKITETEDSFVVFRTDDLVPIAPEELDLGVDPAGNAFRFQEVKRWVRDAVMLTPDVTCRHWPWWLPSAPPPVRVKRDPEPDGMFTTYAECIPLVLEVRDAFDAERELQVLRQELSLIAYGEEAVWDGQVSATGAELRTYDLLLDAAGVGNVLGSGPFNPLFAEGNQGEQCDSTKCPMCILPGAELCGNGGVQGAEQCDDGNRLPGDGCDEFCQVEGAYCGNGKTESWEACDEGAKECPDGSLCETSATCTMSMGSDQRICPDGNICSKDADCACPPEIAANPAACASYKQNSCRFVFDGVCFVAGTVNGQRCSSHADCRSLSSCSPTTGLCTNVFFDKHCARDADCTSCTFEAVWGTCYESAEKCNGNEDCPDSDYCILEPESICRPRTVGGYGVTKPSSCNEFCEDTPRCGDRIVYLDENGNTEQCDDGMHCLDGTACAFGERCLDGSACQPRVPYGMQSTFCNEECRIEEVPSHCGDADVDEDGPDDIPNNADDEECDDGKKCENNTKCVTSADCPTTHSYCASDPRQPCTSLFDCPRGTQCLPANASDLCIAQNFDGCSTQCKREYCGDSITQNGPGSTNLHEQCDPGSTCTQIPGVVNACTSVVSPPTTTCTVNACNSNNGCTSQCLTIDCGNGVEDAAGLDCDISTAADNEECDDGNTVDGDGCSSSCKSESPPPPPCGDGVLDSDGRDNIAGTPDDEECDPNEPPSVPESRCVGGPQDGNTCTSFADCNSGTLCGVCGGSGVCVLGLCVGGTQNGQLCQIASSCFACRTGPSNGCTVNCKNPVAGNCTMDGWEQCDDGPVGSGDGCDNGVIEYCGDGNVDALIGEECDPPDQPLDSICCGDASISCTTNADCGFTNGPCRPEAGQCSSQCRITMNICPKPPLICPGSGTCGDRCLDAPSEECDDGNTNDNDGCSASCDREFCGDSVVNNKTEECDPGSNTATCYNCKNVVCGDCREYLPETCDEGIANGANANDCNTSCEREYCGDTVTQQGLGEQCDDGGLCGNTGNVCKTKNLQACAEEGYVCSPGGGACASDVECGGPPGTCTMKRPACVQGDCDYCNNQCQHIVCGDGYKQCKEECDDGNLASLDGCSSSCLLEFCGDSAVDPDGSDDLPGRADFDDDFDGSIDEADEAFFVGSDDEECDAGWGNSDTVDGACRTNCQNAGCGDGVTDKSLGEQCDTPTCPDGKACTSHAECGSGWCRPRDGDGGCSSACLFEGCGNLHVEKAYGESCDDGGLCSGTGNACSIDTAEADCGAGIPCIPVSGDGCSSSCEPDFSACGNGIVESAGGDGVAGTADDETCDPAGLSSGLCAQTNLACSCPGGGSNCTPEEASCNLGLCDPLTRTCALGKKSCGSDADCDTPCTQTCTEFCTERVRLCGDGYRDMDEQCDDGNAENGDGCSFSCEAERLDLCGNGTVDLFDPDDPGRKVGEECDQGHPFHTLECTPYCRLPHRAPLCGDLRKDPSGAKRTDLLDSLLTQAEGYRLDWSIPGKETLFPKERAAGWYVIPRIFVREGAETPFQKIREKDGFDPVLEQGQCSLCGNGFLNVGEECDSGRLSGGSVPSPRTNLREWQRVAWGLSYARFATQYYWHWYHQLFPFGFHTYDAITAFWYLSHWDRSAYVNYVRNTYGGWYWYYADAAWTALQLSQGQTFIREACSGSCTLQLCGNDRIDPGETCDDDNVQQFGRKLDGDGCSTECFLEAGFDPATGLCGDDAVNAGEQCDDGGRCFDANGKPTSRYCRFDNINSSRKFCPGPDEEMGTADDTNTTCKVVEGDGCNVSCQIEKLTDYCGNGTLDPYEECDNGGMCQGQVPPASCFPGGGAVCGVVTVGGQPYTCPSYQDRHCASDIDCGSSGPCVPIDDDECDTFCRFEFHACGNGLPEPQYGEECDPGGVCSGGPNDGKNCSGNATLCTGGSCVPATPSPTICSTTCTRSTGVCGNRKKEGAEQCDEGSENSNSDTNACRAGGSGKPGCVFAYCGDLVLDREEECDDGNTVAKDGCTNCLVDLCGNGIPDTGETCDDGNTVSGDGCSDWCIRENICGNAELEGSEQCDDGNAGSGDGCSATCTVEYCGNSNVEPGIGEECDAGPGNANTPDSCRLTCQLPFCGDTIKDTHEACDPGMHCKHAPSVSCNDDHECPLGSCDIPPGAFQGSCMGDRTKLCSNDKDCLLGECLVLPKTDPATGKVLCAANCTEPPGCGDGLVHFPEECDYANPRTPSGCATTCQLEHPLLCGNAEPDPGEECDDGNRSSFDGCSKTCQREPVECGGLCAHPDARFVCGNAIPCRMGDLCTVGVCTLRTVCATECTFGLCGNATIDPGEQCDDGGHCTHDPEKSCTTHAACSAGVCNGANAANGTPGTCADETTRACMRDMDCFSLCIPKGGDGCSGDCLSEGPAPTPGTFLTVCQEEITGISGQEGKVGVRIGSGQILAWQQTLLQPHRNPFVRLGNLGTRYLGSSSLSFHLWSPSGVSNFWSVWGGWNGWWNGVYAGCGSVSFPNSVGNHIQMIAGCLDSMSKKRTIPDRAGIMPYQPDGITSYAACQEPKAKLASAATLPPLPPIALPPYAPSELVKNFTQFLCSEYGYPERSFPFLCGNPEGTAPSPLTSQDILPFDLQSNRSTTQSELLFAHTLDAAYRASEGTLLQYIEEAVSALRSMLASALQLYSDLQRVQLTETVCPIDGSPLCP